jgi:hypothetical protein
MNNVPDGYPTPEDDQSGLRVDIGTKDGVVLIQFSKPVVQMALAPPQVRSMAIALLQNAEMALSQTAVQLPPSRLP